MNDLEKMNLSPAMQDMVKFIEFWQNARTLDEFLTCMDRVGTTKDRAWAMQRAAFLRKNGVHLRKRNKKTGAVIDYDFLILQAVAHEAIAKIGGMGAEAAMLVTNLNDVRAEAGLILTELRKYKRFVVDAELAGMEV